MPVWYNVKAYETEAAPSVCLAEKVPDKKGHERSLRYWPEAFFIRAGVSKPGERPHASFIYYVFSIEEVLR